MVSILNYEYNRDSVLLLFQLYFAYLFIISFFFLVSISILNFTRPFLRRWATPWLHCLRRRSADADDGGCRGDKNSRCPVRGRTPRGCRGETKQKQISQKGWLKYSNSDLWRIKVFVSGVKEWQEMSQKEQEVTRQQRAWAQIKPGLASFFWHFQNPQ